ncbi:hypothetical protein PsJ27TS7_49540 [Paenibacillus dendritiformis]
MKAGSAEDGGGNAAENDEAAQSCVNQAVEKPLFFTKGWRWSIFLIQTLALSAS